MVCRYGAVVYPIRPSLRCFHPALTFSGHLIPIWAATFCFHVRGLQEASQKLSLGPPATAITQPDWTALRAAQRHGVRLRTAWVGRLRG